MLKLTFNSQMFLPLLGAFFLEGCAQKPITLIAAPEVISIPIIENHEPLVNLKNQKIIAYGPSPEIPNNRDYTKIRKTVYDKLVKAQGLLPNGYKLRIYEAYRSLSLQKMLFDNNYAQVSAAHPDWSKDQIFDETTKLVSPTINKDGSHNIPPHSTGAAFDLYLIDNKGNIVDMGIEVEDWMRDIDGKLSQTDSRSISNSARQNREIMSKALRSVGFINYPTEYWHWSFGDRYWAHQTGETHAVYGTVE